MSLTIKLKRGAHTHINTTDKAEGEPFYLTDSKELYIGDGDGKEDYFPPVINLAHFADKETPAVNDLIYIHDISKSDANIKARKTTFAEFKTALGIPATLWEDDEASLVPVASASQQLTIASIVVDHASSPNFQVGKGAVNYFEVSEDTPVTVNNTGFLVDGDENTVTIENLKSGTDGISQVVTSNDDGVLGGAGLGTLGEILKAGENGPQWGSTIDGGSLD